MSVGAAGFSPALLCKPRIEENSGEAQVLSDHWAVVISRRRALSVLAEIHGGKAIHTLLDFQPFSGMRLSQALWEAGLGGSASGARGNLLPSSSDAHAAPHAHASSASPGSREAGIASDQPCFTAAVPIADFGEECRWVSGILCRKEATFHHLDVGFP